MVPPRDVLVGGLRVNGGAIIDVFHLVSERVVYFVTTGWNFEVSECGNFKKISIFNSIFHNNSWNRYGTIMKRLYSENVYDMKISKAYKITEGGGGR